MTKELVPYKSRYPVRRKRSELARYAAKVQYLTEEEYLALLDAADHPEHRLLMRLLWETGLRISEALNLTYADIYPDGVNIMGKGKKQRFVPCQTPLLGELFRYRETHGKERIFKRITTEPGALNMIERAAVKAGIKHRSRAKPIGYWPKEQKQEAVRKLRELGGGWRLVWTRQGYALVERYAVHPHIFRHSFAINFIRQTGNPFALQEIGGWSDMEIIKIYMRLATEMPSEAMMRMSFPPV